MKKVLVAILIVALVVVAAIGVFARKDIIYDGYRYGGYSRSGMHSTVNMDKMHQYMVLRADLQAAEYMNSMHDACH